MGADIQALARQAYGAYGDSVGWKNFRGDPMPQFSDLPLPIQTAWAAAADRVSVVLQRGEA